MLPEKANSFLKSSSIWDGNHFYHIGWPPLNVTIFITHMRNPRNECNTNGFGVLLHWIHSLSDSLQTVYVDADQGEETIGVIWILTVWHSDGIPGGENILIKCSFCYNISRRQKRMQNLPACKKFKYFLIFL